MKKRYAVWLVAAGLLSLGACRDAAAAERDGKTQAAEPKIIKAVLVTGARSGIGRKISERLAAQGYFVYATARKDADLAALGAIRNVQALRLDVTRPEDIAAALETISKAGRGLYGLVNNAGVGTTGTIAEMSFEEFDLCMKVNVYGPVMMIKAFQPLVIASQGRIVNIGSVSGVLAGPGIPAYVMNKHAIAISLLFVAGARQGAPELDSPQRFDVYRASSVRRVVCDSVSCGDTHSGATCGAAPLRHE